ncbi:MAG: hypothetical protein ABI728_00320, partial [Betaproteobacteria bacterium]
NRDVEAGEVPAIEVPDQIGSAKQNGIAALLHRSSLPNRKYFAMHRQNWRHPFLTAEIVTEVRGSTGGGWRNYFREWRTTCGL